jgi:3-deoxy-D-manno-octulosonic-acid transferase
MALFLYNVLLTLFSPLLLLFLLYRRAIGKEDADHWDERWGKYPEFVTQEHRSPRFWVHAVSVGELMAAVPVLRELRRRYPDSPILISTTTIGGREVSLKQVPPADTVVYYPLDFRFVVRRAVASVRPDIVVLMEWEIWPNFLSEVEQAGAKIMVVNGRISDRGLRRGLKGRFFVQPGLDLVDYFGMQSAEDARRAALVGASPEKVGNLGNTKFDESVTRLTDSECAALREDLHIPEGAPVWVCGSTRPGEEEIIAEAVRLARQSFPKLVLIVAPRHLERADEAAAPFGADMVRRSAQRQGNTTTSGTLLLDTFGELGRVYAVADVAFIGGSLKPFGGQSVFQPLAQGVPALFGPYMNNQRDIAALSLAEGVGFTVKDADSLAAAVIRMLSLTPEQKQALSDTARGLIDRNQGVAARCVDKVAELLDNR